MQALLGSLSPEDTSKHEGKITSDQVKKISEKLDQILGAAPEPGVDERRNERGEVRPDHLE